MTKKGRVADASSIHQCANCGGTRFAVFSPAGFPSSQRGMTLVELVITIVIIGIAAAALFSAMASITSRSADPMLRQQSLFIAEAYMETLQALPYDDLDNGHELAQKGGVPKGFDGRTIDGLGNYVVTTLVADAMLNGVSAKRIDVRVTDPAGQAITLSGYRTDY